MRPKICRLFYNFRLKILNGRLQDQEIKFNGRHTRHGHSGVKDFLKILGSYLILEVFQILDYFENKDKVVTLGFQKGYVHTSNIPYEFDFVHVWNLKDGKVSKFRVYYDSHYVVGVLTYENVKESKSL